MIAVRNPEVNITKWVDKLMTEITMNLKLFPKRTDLNNFMTPDFQSATKGYWLIEYTKHAELAQTLLMNQFVLADILADAINKKGTPNVSAHVSLYGTVFITVED